MERRTFLTLGGSLLAGCGTKSLVPSEDTDAELRRLALRIEQRNARTAERFRDQRARLTPEELSKQRAAQVLAPFEDALVGMQAYASMSALPLEAQAHPEIQRVFLDGMERLGRGLRGVATLLRRLTPADMAQLDERLAAEPGLLDAATGFVRGELLRGLPEPAERQLEETLDRLAFRMKRGGGEGVIGGFLADLERLDRTARRGDWSALEPTDPRQRQRIERAAAGWEATTTSDDGQQAARTGAGVALILLGLLSIGAGALFGVALIAAGVEAIACFCVGIPLILLGLVVLSLGILGGIASFAWAARLFDGEDTALGEPGALRLDLSDPRWMATGMRAGAGVRVTLTARGSVTIAGQQVGPTGSSRPAPPGAPAPGLPYGAVVARVDLGQPFVVGTMAQTPLGEEGPIDVAVNALATEGDSGTFTVAVG